MGILDSVKKAATKTKLQGEVVLIDRELAAEKKKLGCELFPVLYDWEQQNEGKDLPVEGISAVYQAAKEDIMEWVQKKKPKEEELDVIEVKKANAADSSAAEQAKNAGRWISNTGAAAKLQAEIAYYDREIRLRKEIFGVQVFDEINFETNATSSSDSDGSNDEEPPPAASSEDASTPPKTTDEDVVAAFNRCKASVCKILEKKQAKEQEIAAL